MMKRNMTQSKVEIAASGLRPMRSARKVPARARTRQNALRMMFISNCVVGFVIPAFPRTVPR